MDAAEGRLRCTPGLRLRGWVDGAEKRGAVNASGDMDDQGQVEFRRPLGYSDRCSGDSWTREGGGQPERWKRVTAHWVKENEILNSG